MNVLLIVVVCVALVSAVTVITFRFVTRKLGYGEVVERGVVLTEDGMELPRLFWLGKTQISYRNVESVQLIPFYKGVIATVLLYYGFSVRWMCSRPFGDIVVIKLKSPPCFSKYVLVTPRDATALSEKLKSRIFK